MKGDEDEATILVSKICGACIFLVLLSHPHLKGVVQSRSLPQPRRPVAERKEVEAGHCVSIDLACFWQNRLTCCGRRVVFDGSRLTWGLHPFGFVSVKPKTGL